MKPKNTFQLIILIFLVLTISFACEKEDTEAQLLDGYSEIELEILQLTNEYRAGLSKEPFEMDETLWKYAHQHTEYMIDKEEISHDDFLDRVTEIKAEIGGGAAAENVAMGYTTAQKVVDGWIASDRHRANIEGDYNIIGIAAIERCKRIILLYTNIFK